MHRLRWVTAAFAVAALLGACSDDPEPKIGSEPSESPPTSAVTASTSPTASPSAVELDPEAAVQDWVLARNEALNSGDTTLLRSMTDLSCASCLSLITSIEEVYEAGGKYETEGWKIRSSKTRNVDSPRPTIDAAVVIAGGKTIERAGAEPVVYGPENRIMVFKVHEDRGRFIVDFVGFLS